MTELTADELRRLLSYDPERGDFRWLVFRNNRVRDREIAGGLSGYGYWQIKLNKRLYRAHRLAWLYVHGQWPSGGLDHIDGNPLNNAIANLREATDSQNQHNQGKRRNNTSGYKGVYRPHYSDKWRAQIYINGKGIALGSFDTPEDAATAYSVAAKRYHGDFSKV
jgi:hypothetical protein